MQRQQAALAQTAQADPAAALHIERVQLAHEQWDYKSQGLTQEGAVIVAVVVAYFTAGAGSSLVSAAAGTAGGGAAGATAGAAAGAGLGTTVAIGAAQAGITTLATQASISLINNQGNIGKTLDELGSSASVKTLLTAIITGGVLGGMNFSPTGQPTAGGGAQSFTHQLDLWRAQLSDGDDAQAKAYLDTNQQTFRNDLGEQQKLFTTSGQQLFRPEMFADTANPAFYQQFVQSGISRSLASGLAKELQDSGIDLKNGAVDLAKAVKDNPALAVSAVWNAVKGLPQSVVDGFKETGTAIGEGSAVALNKDLSDKLNAIYGTDTAGAQKAILAIRLIAATTGAAGTAKAATSLSEGAALAVGRKLDEVLDQKATQALIKSGGVMDKTGQPLLDLKQLTGNQKATMGDLLSSHTVRQIVPDGEKLARIQGVGTTGIDDLYKVSRPDLDYVVIEYKYLSKLDASGSSALSKTLDGKQGSETWITGSDRLEKAVGREVAPDIKRAIESGRTETWVVRTYPDGATEIQVLDALGKPKPIDTSKIIISKMNLAGAKS